MLVADVLMLALAGGALVLFGLYVALCARI